MPRYQHPPIETLYQQLDRVISGRMAEIRTAYRLAADGHGEGHPPFQQMWDMATADVRRALDDVDPPTETVHVPLLGATRDEQPRARCQCGLSPGFAAPEAHDEGCAIPAHLHP
jgi:hypothetical protein